MGPEKSYRFGQYRLLPNRRALLAGEQELPVRGRAFDLLLALIERRERPVSKDELLSVVWPGRIVEEGNLTVHIAGLRKLLGGNIIATLSGRGYRFVAPVEEARAGSTDPHSAAQAVDVDTASEPGADSVLPRFLTRLIGRQEDLDRIEAQLQRSRLVTIVGAGGVGKTSIALAAADRLRQRFPDGVWFVEFSSLDDPALAPAVIASALGIQNRGDNVLRSIALFLARLPGAADSGWLRTPAECHRAGERDSATRLPRCRDSRNQPRAAPGRGREPAPGQSAGGSPCRG